MSNVPEPRNANEARIKAARENFAKTDTLWASQPVTARKHDLPAVPAPANHLSGIGGTMTMCSAAPMVSRKADDLAALPASVGDRAKSFDEGQRALLAFIYQTHARTGRPVPIDAGEAAKIMGTTPEKARRFLDTLETAGLLSRSYSSLGPLLGFLPVIGA